MKDKYFYVYCEARDASVNPEYKHYVRLYRETDNGHRLVDQGLGKDKVHLWEKKYKAIHNFENPYPLLD